MFTPKSFGKKGGVRSTRAFSTLPNASRNMPVGILDATPRGTSGDTALSITSSRNEPKRFGMTGPRTWHPTPGPSPKAQVRYRVIRPDTPLVGGARWTGTDPGSRSTRDPRYWNRGGQPPISSGSPGCLDPKKHRRSPNPCFGGTGWSSRPGRPKGHMCAMPTGRRPAPATLLPKKRLKVIR